MLSSDSHQLARSASTVLENEDMKTFIIAFDKMVGDVYCEQLKTKLNKNSAGRLHYGASEFYPYH